MAMLAVLFIVIGVVVVGLGILYRADMAAAGGQNYALRTQADYLAWAGLEHARVRIAADPDTAAQSLAGAPFTVDDAFFYTLTIADRDAHTYDIVCESYYQKDDRQRVRSKLFAVVVYDPDEQTTQLTHIRRVQ